MARLSASVVHNFAVPAASPVPSFHGSQREDAIIASYLPGWFREVSDAAYAAVFPEVPQAHEGNGRGRGRTFGDAFRPRTDRGGGTDILCMKAPARPKNGRFSTAHEMFKGTRVTGEALIKAVLRNFRNRKAQPCVVVHTDGGTFAPSILEWCVRDAGRMFATPTNAEGWAVWNGLPVKPVDDKARGAGGSPASVWVTFLRRELLGYDAKGNPKVKYTPDPAGTYMTIYASFSQRSGAVFKSGTPAQFAADVDAATVLR